MDCSSKKMADEHTCGNSSFDIQKVKKEVYDEPFEMCTADTSEKNSYPLSLEWSLLNAVKKEEILEEPKVVPNVLEKSKRKRVRKIKEKTYVQTSLNIAPKQMPAVSIIDPAVASLKMGAQSEQKNTLNPKNAVSESNIRIEHVFYTDQNSAKQVPCQPSTNTTYSNAFSSLPTNMLRNPVVLSAQQNSYTINPVPNMNSLHPANIIQASQNINFIPGIQSLGGLNLNQNASLALHQTYAQDVNPSTHDPVVGIQPSQSFPIFIGNQVFLVDAATYKNINSTLALRTQPPIMSTGSHIISTLNHPSSTHPGQSTSKGKESSFLINNFRHKGAEKRKRLVRDVFGSTPVIEKVAGRNSDNLKVQGSNSKCINSVVVSVPNNTPLQNEAVKTINSNAISSTCNLVKQTFNSADLCLSSKVSQNSMITPSFQQTFILSPQQSLNFGQTSCSFPSNFLNLVNNPGLIISNAHDLQRPHSDQSIQNTTNINSSITGNVDIVSSVSNSFNVQPGLLNSNTSIVQTTFVSIAPKVAPSTVKNAKESATEMVVPARLFPRESCPLVNKEPLKIKEKTTVTKGNLLNSNQSRKMFTKSGSNSSTARSNKPLNESTKRSDNLKIQSVGTKIMSPTSPELQPDLQDLFDKEFGGNSSENGRVLVGPLTKTELDNIIRNPAELKKYVNIPSDQVVIAPKALAVSSKRSKSSKTHTTNSKVLQVAPNDKTMPIRLNDTCTKFVKVLPKTENMIATSTHPSVNKSFNYNGTNNNNGAVMEQNQFSVPGSKSTEHSAMRTDLKKLAPKINISSSIKVEETNKKEISIMPKDANKIKTINKDSSPKKNNNVVTVNSDCSQLESCSNHELSETKQDPFNGLIRLSFEGDNKLLKDLLRRTTVPLQKLTCGLNDTVNIKEAKLDSTSEQVHSNIKHTVNTHQTVTILDQNIPKKRKLLCCNYPREKQWVPTDRIRDQEMNCRISERPSFYRLKVKDNAKRKSPRINTKPTSKYNQCEIFLSDNDPDHNEAEIKSCAKAKEESKNPSSILVKGLNDPNPQCVLESNGRQSSAHASNFSVEESNLKQEVLLTVPVIKDENAQTVTHPLPSSETEESNSISKEHDESCYNSSESDSDMFDLDTDVLSKSERKRRMLKRHNEVTMFLIKNSSKFSSKEEENKHYCNICNKYKTNGIFNLSNHLKKHLQGLLKCSKCSYEAFNEDALCQHLIKHC